MDAVNKEARSRLDTLQQQFSDLENIHAAVNEQRSRFSAEGGEQTKLGVTGARNACEINDGCLSDSHYKTLERAREQWLESRQEVDVMRKKLHADWNVTARNARSCSPADAGSREVNAL